MSRRLKYLGRVEHDEREPARFEDKVQGWGWLICIACVLGVAVWAHFISDHVGDVRRAQGHTEVAQQQQQARLRRQAARLKVEKTTLGEQRASLVNGCRRLNQLLRGANTASFGDYTLLRAVADAGATVSGVPFVGPLQTAAKAQSWTPLADCSKTVQAQGSDYTLPKPVAFTTMLPPASALAHARR